MTGFCCALMVLSAAYAAFCGDTRKAFLGAWVAGLAGGGICLALGAEFVAILQWILCTVVAIGFMVFTMTLGEYGPASETGMNGRKDWIRVFGAIVVSGLIVGLAWLGLRGAGNTDDITVVASENAVAFGRHLIGEHLVSVETLAMALFVVLLGGVVIARPESTSRKGPK